MNGAVANAVFIPTNTEATAIDISNTDTATKEPSSNDRPLTNHQHTRKEPSSNDRPLTNHHQHTPSFVFSDTLESRMNWSLLSYVVKSSEHHMRESEYNQKLKGATWNVLIMLVVTAAFFGLTNGWRFIDSFWFAFVTLSTIGYGDFTPQTPFSRVIFVVISKVGLGTMTLFLAEAVDYANRQRENARKAMQRVAKADKLRKSGMSVNAQEYWDRIDTDRSGSIEGTEIHKLARWVLESFRPPGEEMKDISEEDVKTEAAVIMKNCDHNNDGTLDEIEFKHYYNTVVINLELQHSALHKKYCFGLVQPTTLLQRLGVKVLISMITFAIMLVIGGSVLNWSEGWWFTDGVYFAFQTSSTIGYGDQSSLYRHWTFISHDINVDSVSQLWSDVTLGYNQSLGEVLPSECLASRGICTVSGDGTSCNCAFSDIAKVILTIYFLLSAGNLAVLFDATMAYTEALQVESKRIAAKVSLEAKEQARRMSNRALSTVGKPAASSIGGKAKGTTTNAKQVQIDKTSQPPTKIVPKIVPTTDPKEEELHTNNHVAKKLSKNIAKLQPNCCKTFTSSTCYRLSGIILSCALYMLFGAAVFLSLEPDTFSNMYESYYFCAITLTTIGYGDFTVSSPGAKIFVIFYGIVGIALISKLLQVVQDEMQDLTEGRVTCAKKLVCCKKSSKTWSDEVSFCVVVLMFLCFCVCDIFVGVEHVFFVLTIKNSLLCFVVLSLDMVGDTCNFSRYNHVCDWYDFISIV